MSKKQKPANSEQIKEAFKNVDRVLLGKMLDTSKNTMSQIANGIIKVSPKRAKDIEEFTCGLVSAKILRPDIFAG